MYYRKPARGGASLAANPLVTAVLCSAIVLVVLMLFGVAIAKAGSGDRDSSTCINNLNQIGKSIKSYMTDWEDTFPTNRNRKGVMWREIRLSDSAGSFEHRFQYGVNWVEALYPYVEKVGDYGDNKSIWCCPQARHRSFPSGGKWVASSYAFNFNLIEASEGIVRMPGNTLLVREMDRKCYAVCRPIEHSRDAAHRPKGAFLTTADPVIGETNPIVHDQGSCVLFADGHVKLVASRSMPSDDKLYFDKKTKTWWNSPDTTIAINP